MYDIAGLVCQRGSSGIHHRRFQAGRRWLRRIMLIIGYSFGSRRPRLDDNVALVQGLVCPRGLVLAQVR